MCRISTCVFCGGSHSKTFVRRGISIVVLYTKNSASNSRRPLAQTQHLGKCARYHQPQSSVPAERMVAWEHRATGESPDMMPPQLIPTRLIMWRRISHRAHSPLLAETVPMTAWCTTNICAGSTTAREPVVTLKTHPGLELHTCNTWQIYSTGAKRYHHRRPGRLELLYGT